MPTTTITFDHETEQRTAIIRTPEHAIRVTEHVDGPATCSLVPANPRQCCIPYGTRKPMEFEEAVDFIRLFLTPLDHLSAA